MAKKPLSALAEFKKATQPLAEFKATFEPLIALQKKYQSVLGYGYLDQPKQNKQPKPIAVTLVDTPLHSGVPPSKFIDTDSKYADLLRDADEAYRHLYKRPHNARTLFVNIPELCPHLVSELEGTGEQAKLIIKGGTPLSWRQFRERHYPNHFLTP